MLVVAGVSLMWMGVRRGDTVSPDRLRRSPVLPVIIMRRHGSVRAMSRMMIAVVRCGHLSLGRGLRLLIPRQHCIHPGDESSELLHVLPEELFGGRVGDAPIVGNQAAFELHVRLDGVHQR